MDLGPLRSAIVSIWEHRSRSLLSALGILVGTMAVMLLISIAVGVREDVRNQVEELGVNLVVVVPGRIDVSNPVGGTGNIGVSPFTNLDVVSLRGTRGVRSVARWMFVGGTVESNAGPVRALPLGVDPDWFKMRFHRFSDGKSFLSGDDPYVVIGPAVANLLYPSMNAVGQSLKVNGVEFKIIGVTQESGSTSFFGGNPFQIVVYIPYETAVKQLARGQTQIDRIWAQTDASVEPEIIKSRIKASLLKTQNGQETFTVLTQDDLLAAIYKVLDILTYLVVGISAIALFVGGVGIMTVMLMNVNERKREIGIRKTVGARRRDIFYQFLTEAILLTVSGGVLGLMMTWIAILGLERWTPIRAVLSIEVILLGFLLSVCVGCFFGLVPAVRAARKDPVESMRDE